MTVRPSVTCKVFPDESDLASGGTVLAKVLDGDWLDVLNDLGSGRVVLADTDAQLSVMTTDSIVQILVDGTPVYWWVIEEPDDAAIKAGEENAQRTTFSGRGQLSVLDRASVPPTMPYDLYPISENRVLSCFSPEFDVSGWGNASVIVDGWGVTDPSLTLYTGKPSGFPTITNISKWIGSSTGTQFADHIGHCFMVKDFVLTDPVLFKIFCAADNRARVFVDGMKVLDIQTSESTTDGFQKCAEYTIFLSAGAHRLGVHLVNTDFDGAEPPNGPGPVLLGNPMAFIADCWTVAPGSGQMLLRLFGSNTSWKIVEFPAQVPGFTIGEAANILLDQVQADGLLGWILRSWTGANDTNGHAFDRLPTIGLKVGQDLASTFKAWTAAGYCDVDVSPASPTFNLYRPTTLGSTRAIDYEHGGLLLDLDVKTQAKGVDCLQVHWSQGQTRVPSSGGTRMGTLAVGAAETLAEAQELGQAYIDQSSVVRQQLTAAVKLDTGAVPGVDYRVGDRLTVRGTLERVTRIAGRIVDILGMVATPTFRDVLLSPEERVALILKRMAQGTLSGQAQFATPVVPNRPRRQAVGAQELTFHPLDPVQVEESPDKQVSASTNVFAIKAYCKAGLPAGSDTTFRYLVNGVDVLGGTGLLPAGVDEVLLPIVAGTGPDPAVQWVEGNIDRLALDTTAVGYLLSDFVVDAWSVV